MCFTPSDIIRRTSTTSRYSSSVQIEDHCERVRRSFDLSEKGVDEQERLFMTTFGNIVGDSIPSTLKRQSGSGSKLQHILLVEQEEDYHNHHHASVCPFAAFKESPSCHNGSTSSGIPLSLKALSIRDQKKELRDFPPLNRKDVKLDSLADKSRTKANNTGFSATTNNVCIPQDWFNIEQEHDEKPLMFGSSQSTSRVLFPEKLHEMLRDAEGDESLKQIVSWQPHGRSFLIHKPIEFVAIALPRYFPCQQKLTSFHRQLNLYGFKRMIQGRDHGAYYHELFVRDRPFLSRFLLRTQIKGNNRVKQNANAAAEQPDFYKMKPCIKYESCNSREERVICAGSPSSFPGEGLASVILSQHNASLPPVRPPEQLTNHHNTNAITMGSIKVDLLRPKNVTQTRTTDFIYKTDFCPRKNARWASLYSALPQTGNNTNSQELRSTSFCMPQVPKEDPSPCIIAGRVDPLEVGTSSSLLKLQLESCTNMMVSYATLNSGGLRGCMSSSPPNLSPRSGRGRKATLLREETKEEKSFYTTDDDDPLLDPSIDDVDQDMLETFESFFIWNRITETLPVV